METKTESLTDSLIERVDRLVQLNAPLEWGNPLLSTTPTSLAVQGLAVRTQALEKAVREIALEVQRLSAQS
jgi:cytochrome c-type biogenesis protein CcmH/NrfF